MALTWFISGRQLSGQNVTLNETDNAELTFTAPSSSGSLSLQLTVTDEMGAVDSDTVKVTVTAVTTPPAPVERKKGGRWRIGLPDFSNAAGFLTRQIKAGLLA